MDPSPYGSGERVGGTTDGVLPANSHESLVDLILGVTIALVAVTTIVVALRIYVRAFFIKKWRADDTMLVCSFFAVAFHDAMICLSQKVIMSVIMLYQIAFISIKIAFLLQYRRVFPLPRVELLCNIGIAFLVVFGISSLISAGVTYGIQFRYTLWNSPVNILGWWLANAALHLITDILIFILPLPLLGMLKLHRPQKLALFASFSLGFL
ncbi:hypothetical protein CTA2_8788 [Colletotrichum tanaceti]|nr:hypothetical protein CTA2_8788 [Colletotrichum tanaceti]